MYFCIPTVQYLKMNPTKEIIIDEAYKLFLNHSYDAVSISDICNAIGLTKGALYYHFKNKDELFQAVIDKYLVIIGIECKDIDKITLKEYNFLTLNHTKKMINSIFKHETEFIPINYFSLLIDSYRHYDGFANKTNSIMDHELAIIRKILDNAIINKEITDTIDVKTIALMHLSIGMGVAGRILKNDSIEDSLRLLENQFDQLYNLLKI
jgi:TetR/AcrR family transcriptional regulator, transcriptional repressor for nem operon